MRVSGKKGGGGQRHKSGDTAGGFLYKTIGVLFLKPPMPALASNELPKPGGRDLSMLC